MDSKKLANPAPLGLMGFGLTTVLLNIHNAGFFPLTSMILALGLCFGGLAQIIAGIMEFKKGSTFGLTAFISYGCFWWSLVLLLILPGLGIGTPSPPAYMACYFAIWGIFTLFMFIGTFKSPAGLRVVFFTLTILFFLLAARDFSGSAAVGIIAGWVGIVCGASAIYLAMAQVIHEQLGRRLLPY